jgi:hypothetical protein
MPRNSVTVCAGTSWEKATRKEICKGIVPLIVVRLVYNISPAHHTRVMGTYVQLILPVRANMVTKIPKERAFGIKAVISKNFANSADVQALSKYRPP